MCKDDALVIIEHYEGLGFEAWRQLAKRFSPSGGQYELDMMGTLMNPKKASKISDLPGEIQRFERNIRTYEAKTGRPFPPEWKSPTFLKILPESHKEELVRRFQMGTRDYDTLVSMVRGFSQEAWFSTKGPTDMEVDTFEKAGGEKGFDFQEWTREASWDEFIDYWAQQHQDDPALDYLGARGRGGGRGGRGPGRGGSRGGVAGAGAGVRMDNRTCFFCNKKGHIAAKCPEKQAGKQPFRRRAAGSLEQHGEDYEESIMGNDRPAGSIEFGRGCNSMELQRCRCSCSDYVAEDAEVIGADMCGVCDGGEVHVLGEEEWSLDDPGADDYEEADVISRTGHMISLPPLQVDAEGWPIAEAYRFAPPGLTTTTGPTTATITSGWTTAVGTHIADLQTSVVVESTIGSSTTTWPSAGVVSTTRPSASVESTATARATAWPSDPWSGSTWPTAGSAGPSASGPSTPWAATWTRPGTSPWAATSASVSAGTIGNDAIFQGGTYVSDKVWQDLINMADSSKAYPDDVFNPRAGPLLVGARSSLGHNRDMSIILDDRGPCIAASPPGVLKASTHLGQCTEVDGDPDLGDESRAYLPRQGPVRSGMRTAAPGGSTGQLGRQLASQAVSERRPTSVDVGEDPWSRSDPWKTVAGRTRVVHKDWANKSVIDRPMLTGANHFKAVEDDIGEATEKGHLDSVVNLKGDFEEENRKLEEKRKKINEEPVQAAESFAISTPTKAAIEEDMPSAAISVRSRRKRTHESGIRTEVDADQSGDADIQVSGEQRRFLSGLAGGKAAVLEPSDRWSAGVSRYRPFRSRMSAEAMQRFRLRRSGAMERRFRRR